MARCRLWAIAAHSTHAEFAANEPDGMWASGPSIKSANTAKDDGVFAVDEVGLHRRQGRVGEERVMPPHGDRCVEIAGVFDAAHHQSGGGPVLRGGERGVLDFGDLGVGDPRSGVRVTNRIRVYCTGVHASSGINAMSS